MDIGTLQATLGADLTQLRTAVGQAERTVKGYDRTVGRELAQAEGRWARYATGVATKLGMIKKAIFSLRGSMALMATALATRTFVKFGAGFDRAMNIVKVVSGATKEEFESLGNKAKEMGEKTEFTARQAADALKFLSMAGLEASQSLVALPQMLDLATAGQIDLAKAADISTNIMTQMGLQVQELTKVNDALVAVQATANTDIYEAANAFIYAGAKAKSFGVDVVELTAMIGMLANSGIKSSMAGTTLRQAMIKLLAPSSDAEAIMKKYNLSITDSTGSLKDFEKILMEVADAQLSTIEITKLFGARAGNIQVILDQGSQALRDYIARIRSMEGVAESAANTIRDDVQGALDELKSTLQGAVLRAWERYRDSVKDGVRAMTKWFRDHATEIQTAFTAIIRTVGFVIDIFKVLWKVMVAIPAGWFEFWGETENQLKKIEIQAAVTAEELKKITPPEKTTWQEFTTFLDEYGRYILRAVIAIGKSLVGVFAMLVGDLLALAKLVAAEFWKTGRIIGYALTLNFEEVKREFGTLVTSMEGFNTQIQVNWAAMGANLEKDWDYFMGNIKKKAGKPQEFATPWGADLYQTRAVAPPPPPSKVTPVDTEAFDKMISNLKFEQAMLRETQTVQQAQTIARQAGIKMETELGRKQYAQILQVVVAIDKETKAIEREKDAVERVLDIVKMWEQVNKEFEESYRKTTLTSMQYEVFKLDELRDKYTQYVHDKVKLDEWYNLEYQKIIDEYVEKNQTMIEISQRTAEAIEQNFSDFFFDAMKGELKSLEDYWNAFLDSIQRSTADVMGQLWKELLVGKGKEEGGQTGKIGGMLGSLGTMVGGLFGGGGGGGTGLPAGTQYATPWGFADGGIVRKPTLGILGEAGPEAVIPLDELDNIRTGGRGLPPIIFNITTPDVQGFRKSQDQIVGDMIAAVDRVNRRNT